MSRQNPSFVTRVNKNLFHVTIKTFAVTSKQFTTYIRFSVTRDTKNKLKFFCCHAYVMPLSRVTLKHETKRLMSCHMILVSREILVMSRLGL